MGCSELGVRSGLGFLSRNTWHWTPCSTKVGLSLKKVHSMGGRGLGVSSDLCMKPPLMWLAEDAVEVGTRDVVP